MIQTIKLQKDSILQVPFNIYDNDFTFIVNNKNYQTNKFVVDLISPIIAKSHQVDPTMNYFIITTTHQGDFKKILNLINFESLEINENEIQFMTEVLEKLGTNLFTTNINEKEISLDNVITLIQRQENNQTFYTDILNKEINFISSHFHEILATHKEELKKLSYDLLEQIIDNENLELETEDELLTFLNELITENEKYSPLFEYVYFSNASVNIINEFLDVFNIEYMTNGTWKSISTRLVQEIDNNKKNKIKNHKMKRKEKVEKPPFFKEVLYSNDKLEGIFDYFRNNSNIKDEVFVTCSSHYGGSINDLLQIQNTKNNFLTGNIQGSWICFEFNKHQINPTHYSIRSFNGLQNAQHPKSWIIEGSQDYEEWIILDEQKDNPLLNGSNIVHTFSINERKEGNEQAFTYLRMKLTGPNWHLNNNQNHHLGICSIEFYGQLI